jgi:hypothetical protein
MTARFRGLTRFELFATIGFGLLLLLFLLPVLFFALLQSATNRKVEEKLAELERAGFPVTLVEVNRRYAYPPEEQNAAWIYEKAFPLLKLSGPAVEGLPPFSRDEWPALGEKMPQEWESRIGELMEERSEAVELFRQAGEMPSARFPIDLTLGWDTLVPHVGSMRAGARLFWLKAVWDAEQENWEEAAAAIETLLASGRALREEPTLISQLTRMAIRLMACQAVERILAAGSPPEEFLLRVQTLFERKSADVFLLRSALQSEVCFGNYIFERIRVAPEEFGRILDTPGRGVTLGAWAYGFSGYLARDHHFYLETMSRLVEAASSPFPDRLTHGLDQLEWQEKVQETFPPLLVSAVIIPTLSRMLESEAISVAEIRLALILLALERFRVDHGRLPTHLSELVPHYLEELPVNPFTGGGFDYRLVDGWAVVAGAGLTGGEQVTRKIPVQRVAPGSK